MNNPFINFIVNVEQSDIEFYIEPFFKNQKNILNYKKSLKPFRNFNPVKL